MPYVAMPPSLPVSSQTLYLPSHGWGRGGSGMPEPHGPLPAICHFSWRREGSGGLADRRSHTDLAHAVGGGANFAFEPGGQEINVFASISVGHAVLFLGVSRNRAFLEARRRSASKSRLGRHPLHPIGWAYLLTSRRNHRSGEGPPATLEIAAPCETQ